MSIFKNLFGSKKEPNSREIVYEFADIMSQLSNPILDTVLLRRSKDDIYMAFDYYIGCLQAMAVNSRDAREELEQVKTLRVRIADFQDIDPEDKMIVSDINAGREFAVFRSARSAQDIREACRLYPEKSKIWMAMQQKYSKRSLDECSKR
jgi:hypothetical protein